MSSSNSNPSPTAASVTLKLYFTFPNSKQEIRRFTTQDADVFSALIEFLESTYSKFFQPPLRFLIQYDDGEDLLTVSSQTELQEGLDLHQAQHGKDAVWKLLCRFDESPVSSVTSPMMLSGLSTPALEALLQPNQHQEMDENEEEVICTKVEPTNVDEQQPAQSSPSHMVAVEEDSSSDGDEELVDDHHSSDDEYVRIEDDEPIATPKSATPKSHDDVATEVAAPVNIEEQVAPTPLPPPATVAVHEKPIVALPIALPVNLKVATASTSAPAVETPVVVESIQVPVSAHRESAAAVAEPTIATPTSVVSDSVDSSSDSADSKESASPTANHVSESDLDACYGAYVKQRAPKRFACLLCPKMFIDHHFVVDHIRRNHSAMLKEQMERATEKSSNGSVASSTSMDAIVSPGSSLVKVADVGTSPSSLSQSSESTQTESSLNPIASTSTQTEPKVDEPSAQHSPSIEIDDVTGHHQYCEPTPSPEASQISEPASNANVVSLSSASASASSTTSASSSRAIHHSITCDGCNMSPIVGIRFHCTTCRVPGGFDLCQECEDRGDKHPQHHVMLKMRTPTPSHYEIPVGRRCPRFDMNIPHYAAISRPKAQFISDVTLADGLQVHAGETLQKVWSIKNIGEQPWPFGTTLKFCGGELMPESENINNADSTGAAVPYAGPGDIVHVSIKIQVPDEVGRFRGTFRLETPDGTRFGPRVWIDLIVPPEEKESEKSQSQSHSPSPAELVAEPKSAHDEDEKLAQQMNAVNIEQSQSSSSKPSANNSSTPPFEYSNQLATLRSMGFQDVELNRYLLLNNQGDLQKVCAWLLTNAQ